MLAKKSNLLIYLILGIVSAVAMQLLTYSAQAKESDNRQIQLEQHYYENLNNALSRVLLEKNYILNVSVKMKKTSSAKEVKPDSAEANLSVGSSEFPISKLGIWRVPEFEKSSTKEVEEFNQSVESVNVNLILDNTLKKETVARIRKLTQKYISSISNFQTRVLLSQVDLKTPQEVLDAEAKERSLASQDTNVKLDKDGKPQPNLATKDNMLDNYKLPLGMIVSTFLIFLLGLIGIFIYRSSESKKIDLLEKQSLQRTEVNQISSMEESDNNMFEESKASEGPALGRVEEAVVGESVHGLPHFFSLLSSNQKSALFLIKSWLNNEPEGAKEALFSISEKASVDDLNKILSELNTDERKRWKNFISIEREPGLAVKADNFLMSEILGHIILPPPEVKQDIRDLVARLSADDIITIANEKPHLAGVLFNIIPTPQITKVISKVSPEKLEEVTLAGLNFNVHDLDESYNDLEFFIKKIETAEQVLDSPLFDKLPDILLNVTPDKEKNLYRSLASKSNIESIKSLAETMFPAELIPELPANLLRAALNQLPLAQRAELFASMSEDIKVKFLDCYKESPKMLDILTMEIEDILSNEQRVKKAEKGFKQNWQKLVYRVRQYIKSDEEMGEEAQNLIHSWAQNLMSSSSGAKNAS